jgi:hypothetical protein
MTLTIVFAITTLMFLGISIWLFIRGLSLAAQVIQLENDVDEAHEIGTQFLNQTKTVMSRIHNDIDKISKYHVTSDDPVVQHLVKVVKQGRDDITGLLENLREAIDEYNTRQDQENSSQTDDQEAT